MDELDKQLTQVLENGETVPSPESVKEALDLYDKKIRRTGIITWISIIVDVAFLIGAGIAFALSNNPKVLIAAAAIFVAALVTQSLAKLWYWVSVTRLTLLKEMKQLQLQVAELSEGNTSSSR